ncbi:ester cyclase [Cryptosporangium japonicum]|uniref:Ester cyclase n=1 Tax=Cryptosporangium japonicum TaxID=80872 RepID=A0ABN0U0G9_9ACTN
MHDIAERAIHLVMAGTVADLRAVVHPDATNREAVDEPPACRGTGPEAFWATALWLRSAFSELAFAVDESVVEGDLAVTYGRMSGRQTGDFVVWNADGRVERAFAPTGRRFEVRHAHFQRVRNGLVVEHWAVRDDQSMALQLGWIPPSPLYLARCARATRRARRAAAAATAA